MRCRVCARTRVRRVSLKSPSRARHRQADDVLPIQRKGKHTCDHGHGAINGEGRTHGESGGGHGVAAETHQALVDDQPRWLAQSGEVPASCHGVECSAQHEEDCCQTKVLYEQHAHQVRDGSSAASARSRE